MTDRRKRTSFQESDLERKSSSERSSSVQKTPTFDNLPKNDSKNEKRPAMSHRKSLPAAAFRRPSHMDGKPIHKLSTASYMHKDSKTESPDMRESPFRRSSRLDLSQYRRMSVWDRLNPGFRPSAGSSSTTKPTIKYQNTYIVGTPEGKEKFNPTVVEPMLYRILDSLLGDETYDAMKCRNLVALVSDNIKDQVKALDFSKRYRYICWVSICEAGGQSLEVASRCMWSSGVDEEVSVTYINQSLKLMAVATVFAIYLE